MYKLGLKLLESSALVFFLMYLQIAPPQARVDWLLPYCGASVLSAVALLYLTRVRWQFNPLFFGIYLYFFSGLIGLVGAIDELNTLYGELGAAAMLGWILLAGAACHVSSARGFIGVLPASNRQSLQLLGVCFGCVVIAGLFRSQKIMGEFLPFLILFGARTILLKQIVQRAGVPQ